MALGKINLECGYLLAMRLSVIKFFFFLSLFLKFSIMTIYYAQEHVYFSNIFILG